MGKVTTLVVTAVIALAFGFVGAFAAVNVFADELRGPQGATGIQGPPGHDGADGVDGAQGPPGPAGKAGKAAKQPAAQGYDLGSDNCAGTAFGVVTDVRVVGNHLQVDRKQVCVRQSATARYRPRTRSRTARPSGHS